MYWTFEQDEAFREDTKRRKREKEQLDNKNKQNNKITKLKLLINDKSASDGEIINAIRILQNMNIEL